MLNHVALVLGTVLAMPAVPERLVKVHVSHDQQISSRLNILKKKTPNENILSNLPSFIIVNFTPIIFFLQKT